MMSIAHIIHPVVVPESDLIVAQPITFETMRLAKSFSQHKDRISLFAVQYANESDIPLPEAFHRTPDLTRSVGDLKGFAKWRKLALIGDILDSLYNQSEAECFIYTNVDIGVQPYFYDSIVALIEKGLDAFVINRRTIEATFGSLEEIPLMWAQCGESHPGHDCFIFRRDAYPRYRLGNVCVGTRLVGRVMVWNLLAHARRFVEFKDLHLTFHIGREKPWKSSEFGDYDRHNHTEALNVLGELDTSHGLLARLEKDYPEYLVAIDTASLTQPTD